MSCTNTHLLCECRECEQIGTRSSCVAHPSD